MNIKTGFFPYLVSSHPCGSKLRKDQTLVIHNFFQGYRPYPVNKFLCAECSLAGGTPHVYAFCIKNEDPCVEIGQFRRHLLVQLARPRVEGTGQDDTNHQFQVATSRRLRENLLRLSTGIEDLEDIQADLDQALDGCVVTC